MNERKVCMKTILLSMVIAGSVVFGGCDAEEHVQSSQNSCGRTKEFVLVDTPMSYFDGVQACADLHGALGKPYGAAEHRAFFMACTMDNTRPPSCWTAYADPETVLEEYRTETLHYPVCEVWK